jgi:hypothetical protein
MMKHAKYRGLIVVAATALTTFVGVSSVSATVLCKVEGIGPPTGTTCPSGQAYGGGTEIHMVNKGRIAFDGETFNIECEVATIKGKTANEGSGTETVKVNLELFSFTICGPTTYATLKPGELEIHWIEGTHNGTLTGNGQEITTVTSTIFGNIHCIFSVTNQSLGDVTGGNPATFTSNAKIKRLPTNSLCPSEGAWTASYEITTPKPLFIAGHT